MKKNLFVIFLVIFLDIVGFSLLFPLFPKLIDYYFSAGDLFDFQSFVQSVMGRDLSKIQIYVLLGGLLGSLYSIFQFIFSPLWGKVSDHRGRRPIMLMSSFGLMVAYVLWLYSDAFWLFFVSRVIAGIMSANMSVATAVASDLSVKGEGKSKNMAIVGMGFAFGFIVGPGLGGLLTFIPYEGLNHLLGVSHPFSIHALFSFLFALINALLVYFVLKETHRVPVKRPLIFNPLKLIFLGPSFHQNVRATQRAYFSYITYFSAMEFTLTFFTFDRLGYSVRDNALMFTFIGLTLAFIQGGVVRRVDFKDKQKKWVSLSFLIQVVAMIILALTSQSWSLYIALLILGVTSALITPLLTGMNAESVNEQTQGEVLGLFRSQGALARAIGPLMGALIYFRFDSQVLYFFCAFSCLVAWRSLSAYDHSAIPSKS